MRNIVGTIDGNDVIYVPEKDILFCKNTTVPYTLIRQLLKSDCDRESIPEKNLVITKDRRSVTLGCLNTTMSNIWDIDKQIKKIRY